jgi:hypothetical protein
MTQNRSCGAIGKDSERKQMKINKKVAAILITAVAITGSATALANASGAKSGLKKVANQIHMKDGLGGMKGGPKGGEFKNSNKEAIVLSTLGIDAATLKSRLEAGESLATIAGAKKDALIAALVADETKQIDAAVTAGKLTADQAATLKSGLTAHVTEEVNEVGHMRGMMDGKRGGKGGHGRGHHDGGKGLPQGSTNGIPSTTTTSAN